MVKRNKIELNKYQYEQSITARVKKSIFQYSSKCDIYKGELDFFYAVNGKGNGYWGLSDYSKNKNYTLFSNEEEFSEGQQVLRTHLSYERNNRVIKLAKECFKQQNGGKLFCEICGFNFYKTFGELRRDFIEVHHSIPVFKLKQGDTTKIEDIVMFALFVIGFYIDVNFG